MARRLNDLIQPWAYVAPEDAWMPEGFEEPVEPQLHRPSLLIPEDVRSHLGEWWLPSDRQKARTPNFDIASTCTVDGVRGLLLVEAKAHEGELQNEEAGRSIGNDPSGERAVSHETIGRAIEEARIALSDATSVPWSISRDTHYQMCNRFAWSWKLTDLGVPIVLVYLGFLGAGEMADQSTPLPDHALWEALVMQHSAPLFPNQIWNHRWLVRGVPLIPLIRSTVQPLDGPVV